jgi:hypothetical protein
VSESERVKESSCSGKIYLENHETRFGFSDSAELEAKGPEFRSLRSILLSAVGGSNLADTSEKTFLWACF